MLCFLVRYRLVSDRLFLPIYFRIIALALGNHMVSANEANLNVDQCISWIVQDVYHIHIPLQSVTRPCVYLWDMWYIVAFRRLQKSMQSCLTMTKRK